MFILWNGGKVGMNYAPTHFGTSIPEVVDIKENDDGIDNISGYQYRISISYVENDMD